MTAPHKSISAWDGSGIGTNEIVSVGSPDGVPKLPVRSKAKANVPKLDGNEVGSTANPA